MRRVGGTWPFVHANRAEAAGLKHPHQLQTNHLEQREERHDQTRSIADVGKEILETARLGFREACEQLVHTHFDGNLLGRQEHPGPELRAFDDGLKRRQQAEEIDFELRLVVVAGDGRHTLVWTLPLGRAHLLALVEQACSGLELLVLEQPAHQGVARVVLLALDAAAVSGRGKSIFDLMWMSVAAITRNSPATSRLSSCIIWMASRYCAVMSAMGMS